MTKNEEFRRMLKRQSIFTARSSMFVGYLSDARPNQPISLMANPMKIAMSYAALEGACGYMIELTKSSSISLDYSEQARFLSRSLLLSPIRDRNKLDVIDFCNWLCLSCTSSMPNFKSDPLARLDLLKKIRHQIFHVPTETTTVYQDASTNHNHIALLRSMRKYNPWKHLPADVKRSSAMVLAPNLQTDEAAAWAYETVILAAETMAGWIPRDGKGLERIGSPLINFDAES